VYQIEKLLKDSGDKVPSDLKSKLEKGSKELKEMVEKPDFDQDAVKAKTEEVMKDLQEAGAKIYEDVSKAQATTESKDDSKEEKKDDKDSGAVEGEVV